jgi:hypothetical protein
MAESFLGSFAKLWKATAIFMSVRVEQQSSHWTDFHEIWYLSIARKYVEKFKASFTSDKTNG